jgi:hypothetical protein
MGLAIGFAVFFILWQYSENELKSDLKTPFENILETKGVLGDQLCIFIMHYYLFLKNAAAVYTHSRR